MLTFFQNDDSGDMLQNALENLEESIQQINVEDLLSEEDEEFVQGLELDLGDLDENQLLTLIDFCTDIKVQSNSQELKLEFNTLPGGEEVTPFEDSEGSNSENGESVVYKLGEKIERYLRAFLTSISKQKLECSECQNRLSEEIGELMELFLSEIDSRIDLGQEIDLKIKGDDDEKIENFDDEILRIESEIQALEAK